MISKRLNQIKKNYLDTGLAYWSTDIVKYYYLQLSQIKCKYNYNILKNAFKTLNMFHIETPSPHTSLASTSPYFSRAHFPSFHFSFCHLLLSSFPPSGFKASRIPEASTIKDKNQDILGFLPPSLSLVMDQREERLHWQRKPFHRLQGQIAVIMQPEEGTSPKNRGPDITCNLQPSTLFLGALEMSQTSLQQEAPLFSSHCIPAKE